ncbi:MAG: EscU/YscU/HrcU family type III secretion system export apparatus switch protein [Geminicoccaceae bacterium]|nr:EscU/YscU/HrcU family type III secretion system export apparatus switch protein [Geminicoccaceae bacterium]MCX8101209.1 EscU/YscU/HrcU family type III secretion system export apparatus switch protein [Geminicoccaceae bacterium]MDW8368956.1 EscU/YscU/HrcU family type III secretion system export apparatus switch protein [Geminicoccaceae bacterium]
MDGSRVAVALRWDPEEGGAPRVTAKGRGVLAARIVELARAHGIPVREDPALLGLLERLAAGAPIPVAAFAAVAEIMVHLYRLDARLAAGRRAVDAPGSGR